MEEIKIVIGANYGDEGKGQITDYFCHKAYKQSKACCVVLSNGGAQRGHTVITPDGRRHVFKHFGSGYFASADTYIPEQYLINPLEFVREFKELFPRYPWAYVHPKCIVTTPWDMIANMVIEDFRGDNRHGSCGMGIWETIQRNTFIPLTWDDCIRLPHKYIRDTFSQMVIDYYCDRFARLQIHNLNEWSEVFFGHNLCDLFADRVKTMSHRVKTESYSALNAYDTLVFENGQGLLLDQSRTPIENTTPSNTGLKNPMEIISEHFSEKGTDIEVCYVTRTYLTRHGAGDFPEVSAKEISERIETDETNKPNEYQGRLRYGFLDIQNLEQRILADSEPYREYINTLSLAQMHKNEFSMLDMVSTKIDKIYHSKGKTRNEVYE